MTIDPASAAAGAALACVAVIVLSLLLERTGFHLHGVQCHRCGWESDLYPRRAEAVRAAQEHRCAAERGTDA